MSVSRPGSTPLTNVNAVNTAPATGEIPAYLRPLVALNPNLPTYYAQDPGLRAFLDANKANIVQWEKPPAGKVADSVNMETWCHTTTIVPAKVRDQEYIIGVARGSAYANAGQVKFPLNNGQFATSEGRINFVGKTKDYLATQKVADEHGHYPGAITVDIKFPLAGKPGENISFAYCRVQPDEKGQFHPSFSGWPDSFKGVWGGYSGRELDWTVQGGKKVQVDSPDGCSERSTGKVVG